MNRMDLIPTARYLLQSANKGKCTTVAYLNDQSEVSRTIADVSGWGAVDTVKNTEMRLRGRCCGASVRTSAVCFRSSRVPTPIVP